MPKSREVDAYIAQAPAEARGMLERIRDTITKVAPSAEEKLSYGMPFYEYRLKGFKGRLAYFAAYKEHISFHALPHDLPADLARQLVRYRAARSTLHFPIGAPVPVGLLRKLVQLRKAEIDRVP